MMVKLSDINTKHWQFGLNAPGVVTDIDDIKQCIYVLLVTRKGEVPLRPHFGSDIFNYIDNPVGAAIPKIKKAIVDAITEFEPRIKKIRRINVKVSYE